MHRNLASFLACLRQEGELLEISAEVDPYLEAAEIHRRIVAQAGPALLFTNIKGSPIPLATNLFGTTKRIDLAFGKKPENFVRELVSFAENFMPPSLSNFWDSRSTLFSLTKLGTKLGNTAPILESATAEPAIDKLPLLTTWKEDGGPFFTLPLVYSHLPNTKQHNLGIYRLQRFDNASTGFHCQIGKGAGFHLARARELKQKLPVNVFIGGAPALLVSAVAPLPENVPELLLASMLLGEKVTMTKNPFGPLPLLSEAEFALVGEVDPFETMPEGPFGDHYGYYSLKHDYPVFRIKAVLSRKNPVCTATVVGPGRQEDCFLGDYLQDLLSPIFPLVMPSVLSLWSYAESGFHSLAAAVVRERYRREAMVSAFRILGEGQLSLTKFLLLTDTKIDLRNFKATLEHILARADFSRDLFVFSNLAMDTLDYTGPKVNEGSKGVLMGLGTAIRDLPREFSGQLPGEVLDARVFCDGCLVVSGAGYAADQALPSKLAQLPIFSRWPLIILVDDAKAATKSSWDFIWTAFTRFEPARDIYSASQSIHNNHLQHNAPIVIDSRMKPWYPAVLSCDPETAALVDGRWGIYGVGPHQRC